MSNTAQSSPVSATNISSESSDNSSVQINLANIFGRIVSVYRRSDNSQIIQIYAANAQKTYKCTVSSSIFAPMREGDAISARCRVQQLADGSMILHMISDPYVVVGVDKNTLIQSMIRFLRGTGKGARAAENIYNSLVQKIGAENISSHLDELSVNYVTESDPRSLSAMQPHLSPREATKFYFNWYNQRSMRRLYLLGLNKKDIRQISRRIPIPRIYEQALKNPFAIYELAYNKCQEMCRRFSIETDDNMLKGGLLVRYIYKRQEDSCYVGVSTAQCMKQFPWIADLKNYLIQHFPIVIDMATVYLEYQYEVETYVAQYCNKLLNSPKRKIEDAMIVFRDSSITQEQKDAVLSAAREPISIVTGYAGTGKTTIIREMVMALRSLDINYAIVSFTGKAVSRVKEVLGSHISVMTMDRMIAQSKSMPFKFRHLIIDEISMVTTELLYRFLQAFKFPYYITMVGDDKQLQPIGWGNLFTMLLRSSVIPVKRFTKIFRTRCSNGPNYAITNMLRMINYDPDDPEDFSLSIGGNFMLMEGSISTVTEIISHLKMAGISADDLKIICPYNQPLREINHAAQQIYTGDAVSCMDMKQNTWTLGDTVIMQTNNYDINVMNGEEGFIADLDEDKIVVEFKDGNKYPFLCQSSKRDSAQQIWSEMGGDTMFNDLNCTDVLNLSYAISIHKSQGSEWNNVIIYIPDHPANEHFLNMNMLVTALTRNKRNVFVIGDRETVERACIRPPKERYDNLWRRLQDLNLDDNSALEFNLDNDPTVFSRRAILPLMLQPAPPPVFDNTSTETNVATPNQTVSTEQNFIPAIASSSIAQA